MTTRRDPDELLAAYLADGMTVLPDRVVDAVLREAHRSRRRPAHHAWRTRSTLTVALGAAAALAVLVLGGALYFGQRDQTIDGEPSPTALASPGQSQPAVVVPSATSSPLPTASPTPTASPSPDPSIAPPADLQAYVDSIDRRYTKLPPLAMTLLLDGSAKSRIHIDRSGAVRVEYFASADATDPMTWKILKGHDYDLMAIVGGKKAWVKDIVRIGEDPRGYLVGESMPFGAGECDVNWGSSDGGSATAASASPSGPTWSYAGLEDVAGRPAHHLTCSTGGDLWIDTQTGLILRTRDAARDAAGEPIKGEFRTNEVTEIEFGEQPASLFDLRPPDGVARVEGPLECTRDLICTKLPPNSDTVAP